MRLTALFALIFLLLLPAGAAQADPAAGATPPPAVLDFKMKELGGKEIYLAKKYAGKVVLLVNVASQCGFTPQYEQLQALHEKYAEEGLAVVGIPCNQFGKQEPGDAEAIRKFCSTNFGVEFDLLAKVDVNGDGACPLYKFLTGEKTNGKLAGKIKWNFTKFLVDRNGRVVARFEPGTKPDDERVITAIEKALGKT
jgi:glutathione peroxidase